MAYFEDLETGERFTTPGRTITDGMASVLISVGGFAAPMFNNEEAAKKTPLGWRALPGGVTFMLMGGLAETYGASSRPAGRPATPGGIGLFVGCRSMRLMTPVRVGDTVHLESERVELEETSNPRWGRVIDREALINQKGETVCTADIVHLHERKPK